MALAKRATSGVTVRSSVANSRRMSVEILNRGQAGCSSEQPEVGPFIWSSRNRSVTVAVMSGDQSVARGSADRSFSGGFGGRDWLAIQLRGVTGIDDVVPEKRPGTHASVMVRIDNAIGSQSTERLSLQWRPDGLVLGAHPAELMKQAEATYRTGRGQRILDFAAGRPAGWRVRPHVHLAYHSASILQRVYLSCDLDLDEYVHGWLGNDFAPRPRVQPRRGP